MASTMRMWLWPLCLLAVHCLVLSTGQNYEASEYLSKFNYELGQAGQDVSSDADSSAQVKTLPNDDEDSSMINFEPLGMVQEDVMTDSNAKDVEGPIDIPVADIKEPVVVRKEAFCLGCPTVIDLSIPENRNAIHKYLETPVSELLSQSPYKSVTPTILSATKQVESNIKYAITFAIDLTQYNENESASGEEGSPPERRVCAIEFVLDGPETKFEYNNCTADMFANSPAKAPESDESGVDPLLELSQMVKDEVKQEMKPIDFDESTQNSKDSLVVENVRKRRSSEQGALRDIDKNEQDLVYRFAELAVRTLDEVDPDNNKRILLGVTEAKKQIVNGIMYHLVMQVGTSTCQENEEGHSGDGCVENQLYPEKMCRVKILRSWADESPLNAKVVRCECADVWPEDLPSEPLWSGRTRRSTQDNWPSTDGWKDYDLKDGSQSDCLEKVMTSFQDVLNVKDVSKVATIRDAHTRVNKETSQPEMVVTIVLTDTAKLKMMGDVKKPMVVSSRVVCSQRLKRSSPGPGGLSDADVNDPYVKEITQFGLSEIQKSVNSPYQHVLVRIIEAKRQVVAGTLFHFKFEIGPTSCLKTDQSSTNQNCNATSSEQLLLCSFKVWDQPWTKLREIKDLDCGASRSKREVLLGGLQDISVEDPYVKELAAFALAEIDKGLNSPYQQKVVRVVEAKTQVVAGTLMRLKLELAKTNCLKSGSVAATECVHSADEPTTMCSVKVVDQAWLNKRELLDVQCGRTRSKRDISSQTSGAKDAAHKTSSSKPVFLHVDVDDLYIKSLAKYAIGEIDRQTNTPYHHKLLHIVSSQVEHTSVTKVKLGLYLTLSSCKKSSRYKACPVLTGAPRQMCNVELFHSAIPPEMTAVTNINCDGHKMNAPHNEGFAEENGDVHAELFRGFMRRFNRTYASDEELQKRYQIFQQNMKYIQRIQDQEQGTARYGPTIFADLTPTEFKNTYLGLKPNLRQENAIPALKADIPNIKLPTSFDWRDHNAVTPVKNQGACGSCWAFAVTGNLEGQYAIKHGKLLSLSEQELVDCDTLDDGCKGGLPDNAYHALEQLGGIELEKDYPYEGADEQCHFNSSIARVHVKSSVNITTNEEDMAKWLVKNGPIAIGINANAMQFYMGGVSHPLHFLCSPDNLDHGVLIVGYGVHTYPMFHKVLPFWVIKNSWGDRWGEQGYYRVFRGDGSCGVNQMASSAVVD